LDDLAVEAVLLAILAKVKQFQKQTKNFVLSLSLSLYLSLFRLACVADNSVEEIIKLSFLRNRFFKKEKLTQIKK